MLSANGFSTPGCKLRGAFDFEFIILVQGERNEANFILQVTGTIYWIDYLFPMVDFWHFCAGRLLDPLLRFIDLYVWVFATLSLSDSSVVLSEVRYCKQLAVEEHQLASLQRNPVESYFCFSDFYFFFGGFILGISLIPFHDLTDMASNLTSFSLHLMS